MVNAISGSSYDVTSIWQNLFNKIDENGDGSIDKAEMESVVSKSGLSVKDVFSKLDTDQDGVIGQNDFEEALSKLRAQHPNRPPPPTDMGPNPEEMFNKIDENGDGSITKDELTSFMGEKSTDVDRIFAEVDTDGDGVISRSESDAHMEKMEEERKGGPPPGPPPDFAATNAGDGQEWEAKMIEKLLSAYDAVSTGPGDSISRYT